MTKGTDPHGIDALRQVESDWLHCPVLKEPRVP